MGVPRFYKQFISYQKYSNLLPTSLPAEVHTLSIDMNGMLHAVAQMVYAYGSDSTETLARTQIISTMTMAELEVEYHNALVAKLAMIVQLVRPSVALVLAIDGVAPQAKIRQQRQRRYRAAMERSENQTKFDSNSITTGTDFMIRLDAFLQDWLTKNAVSLCPTIIYSGHRMLGEGEHKIMDIFRSKTTWHSSSMVHVLYGLDADLIMLSLVAPVHNIYLIREDIKNLVNIESLKQGLINDMGTPHRTGTEIVDFLVIMAMFGNDFLPAVVSLSNMGNINRLLEIYAKVGKPLTVRAGTQNNLIWPHVHEFMNEVSRLEKLFLTQMTYKPDKYHLSNTLDNNVISMNTPNGTKYRINYDSFKFDWYNYILSSHSDIKNPVFEPFIMTDDNFNLLIYTYMVGMAWIVVYYTEGYAHINQSFVYPFFHAPLLSELAEMSGLLAQNPKRMDEHRIQPGLTFEIPHQLLSVLPKGSLNLIPTLFRQFVLSKSCPIADMFPESFKVDLEGSHHGSAIVPAVDPGRVDAAVQSLVFTKEQRTWYFDHDRLLQIERVAAPQVMDAGPIIRIANPKKKFPPRSNSPVRPPTEIWNEVYGKKKK